MEDRLSSLPDEVIFHVLSFLPPKMFVQTSILAKCWRFRWKHVPRFVATTNITQVRSQNMLNTSGCFFNIGSGTSTHEFESWIATVIERNPRNLLVDLNFQLPLPRCLFTSKTLFYLRILNSGDIPVDGTIYFPALKNLELVNVGYFSTSSLQELLLGCPVLEELTIERGIVPGLIYSETLITLVIDIEVLEEFETLDLVLPSLRYLHFCCRVSMVERIGGTVDSLNEADIDLTNVDDICLPNWVMDFVSALFNVKCLTLSTRPIDTPTFNFFSELVDVKFYNLIQLNLHSDWRFITYFLENADNLQVLTIHSAVEPCDCHDQCLMDSKQESAAFLASHPETTHALINNGSCPIDEFDVLDMVDPGIDVACRDQYWTEPKQVPACLLSQLEAVSLVDFGWRTENEFDMVKYILRNAKMLKRMEIKCTQNYQLDLNVKREAIKKFAMFEIESTLCELVLTLDDQATEIESVSSSRSGC